MARNVLMIQIQSINSANELKLATNFFIQNCLSSWKLLTPRQLGNESLSKITFLLTKETFRNELFIKMMLKNRH